MNKNAAAFGCQVLGILGGFASLILIIVSRRDYYALWLVGALISYAVGARLEISVLQESCKKGVKKNG